MRVRVWSKHLGPNGLYLWQTLKGRDEKDLSNESMQFDIDMCQKSLSSYKNE